MAEVTELYDWSAADYARHGRFVADLAHSLVGLLAPAPGERILDLGCGDGELTERIAAVGAVVTGVDGSPDMVAASRARGLDARVMDGENLSFSQEFDAVFSNAALHWMRRPEAVLDGVARALKPGGRFVGELGGHGNIASIAVALRAVLGGDGPDAADIWFFPTADRYAALLESRGFSVRSIALTPRPTLLPGGMQPWLSTFAMPFLRGASKRERADIMEAVERLLAPSLRDDQGRWVADYVRLRFAADITG
jgi:SAM-dependent methyltransferase